MTFTHENISPSRRVPWAALMGIFGVLWVLPPVIHDAFHLCPVRPDGVSGASAMPNWARKYGVDCSVCHTTVPSLTRAGYMFRAAGFRMPDEYGTEAKFNGLRDMYAARIREQYIVHQVTGGTAPSDKNGFSFNEMTFYPISGAIGKWWAAESELTFDPDTATEVENAYVRATYPHKDWLFTARAGIMHPAEGYGGGDRPISNIRPMFQTTTAKRGSFDTGVKLWNLDQQGGEVGASYKDSRLTLAVFNGINWEAGGVGPADGGGLGLHSNPDDNNNKKDYLLNFVQLFGDKASLQVEIWKGYTTVTEDTSGATVAPFEDRFWRSIYYGNYKLLGDKLDFLGGYEVGRDHFANSTNGDTAGTFMNNGWFGEFRSKLHEHLTAGFRYDTFKPNRDANDNRLQAYTLTAAFPFSEVKFLIDAQAKKTEKTSPTKDQWDKLLRMEWMVIF